MRGLSDRDIESLVREARLGQISKSTVCEITKCSHGQEAATVFEAAPTRTDPRLLVERTIAQTRLSWALALMNEPEQAAELLVEAVMITTGNGDRRGLDLIRIRRVREQHLGRWRSVPGVRRLDAALRAAQAD